MNLLRSSQKYPRGTFLLCYNVGKQPFGERQMGVLRQPHVVSGVSWNGGLVVGLRAGNNMLGDFKNTLCEGVWEIVPLKNNG